MFATVMSKEFADYNIRVNSVVQGKTYKQTEKKITKWTLPLKNYVG